MSDALDVAYVEIEPDFSTFNRNVESGVRDAARELDSTLTGTLNDLEGEFQDFADAALSEVQDALDRIADAGEDSADEIDSAYGDLENAIRNAFDGAQRSAESAFDDIRRDADIAFTDIETEAAAAADEMERSFQETGDTVGTSVREGADEGSGGFLDLANSAFNAGTDIRGAMVGAAGAAGIGAIVVAVGAAIDAFIDMGREALDLEGDIIRITQATDSGFSTAAVDEYREALLDLQSEYGVLTEDLVPALNTAIVQGVPEDNVISFLETATQSAVVSGSDLTDTVSVINGLMAQFEGEFADAVFRPLIGFDKIEIIHRAEEIGTLEISNLPFEDCCTVFTPRHPATRPRLEKVEEAEKDLDAGELMREAVEKAECVRFDAHGELMA